ncbi:hypothetical protein [Candidatus Poriferisodalis sp.]|uniref:hypothetical protein n=1 Tax=Candidatus Poriferisodalis sp. TaxID=3101277 RepID=UPI003B0126AE
MNLVERVVALHRALDNADIPHAFGGALALAWCTQQARGTIDIDMNLFVGVDRVEWALAALPEGVTVTQANRHELETDGQARLWWDTTPLDVFLNTTPFHEAAAGRARVEQFGGAQVPFLACRDLAVFKAFFDRTRDWADLEDMNSAGTLDHEAVLGVLARYLGGDDHRVARLRSLAV